MRPALQAFAAIRAVLFFPIALALALHHLVRKRQVVGPPPRRTRMAVAALLQPPRTVLIPLAPPIPHVARAAYTAWIAPDRLIGPTAVAQPGLAELVESYAYATPPGSPLAYSPVRASGSTVEQQITFNAIPRCRLDPLARAHLIHQLEVQDIPFGGDDLQRLFEMYSVNPWAGHPGILAEISAFMSLPCLPPNSLCGTAFLIVGPGRPAKTQFFELDRYTYSSYVHRVMTVSEEAQAQQERRALMTAAVWERIGKSLEAMIENAGGEAIAHLSGDKQRLRERSIHVHPTSGLRISHALILPGAKRLGILNRSDSIVLGLKDAHELFLNLSQGRLLA